MVTLQAVGISTSLYVGDTAVPVCEDDDDNEEDEQDKDVISRMSLSIQFHVVANLFVYIRL